MIKRSQLNADSLLVGYPVKLYFDIDICLESNIGIDCQQIVNNLIKIFAEQCMKSFNITCSDDDIIVLKSYSTLKGSYHVVFRNVVFANNSVCKRFICDTVNNLGVDTKRGIEVKDKRGTSCFAFDQGIY